MIPGLIVQAARHIGGKPDRILVVPDVPDLVIQVVAFRAPLHTHSAHEHIHVELKILRHCKVGHKNVGVVDKVMNGRKQGVIRVGHTQCCSLPDNRV